MPPVLGIDPGTRKVGYAIVDAAGEALVLGIEPVDTFTGRLQALAKAHPISAIALGRGTHAGEIRALLDGFSVPVHLVDETDTTYRARALYFRDHPPRGWRRLVPIGFQLPPRSIDDYAALLIARRFLGQSG